MTIQVFLVLPTRMPNDVNRVSRCSPGGRFLTVRSVSAGTAISGMPILDVDQARSIIVIKRSMGHGYAGIDNELYVDPKTSMFFSDAKSALTELTAAVKTLVG